MNCVESNNVSFVPLLGTNLPGEEIMDIYWGARSAFEESHPNNMVDASDAYVLTVFPFKWGDEIPDAYEVDNYATGMVDGKPALCKMDETRQVLMLDDEEVKRYIFCFSATTSASMSANMQDNMYSINATGTGE